MTNSPRSRRNLVKTLLLAMPATAITRAALGADVDKVDVKDPLAVSVGYVENAAQADTKKFPSYVKGSNCENCLQLQGSAGASYRPCTVFKGKLVAVGGWCSAWTAEM
jgi:hypothetical protein